jgi:hypothetical protein
LLIILFKNKNKNKLKKRKNKNKKKKQNKKEGGGSTTPLGRFEVAKPSPPHGQTLKTF